MHNSSFSCKTRCGSRATRPSTPVPDHRPVRPISVQY